jgi:uncharacterized membrane protein
MLSVTNKLFMLSVVTLNVVMLSVIMMNVTMLDVTIKPNMLSAFMLNIALLSIMAFLCVYTVALFQELQRTSQWPLLKYFLKKNSRKRFD